jgi:hypothetical protein
MTVRAWKRLSHCSEAYDAHNQNVDQRDTDGSSPLQLSCHGPSLDDDSDTVDDNL